VVVVASMIEREAQVDQDRATIAGVIYNRLVLGRRSGSTRPCCTTIRRRTGS
jgi:cell division protein YceG involved in septum cleavage